MRPGRTTARMDRLRAVEREFWVARHAVAALRAALDRDSALLSAADLSAADLRAHAGRLEETYFIRLFAEFETGLKGYWTAGLGRDPMTRVMDVIDAVASRHRVLAECRQKVHAARRDRNHLVHAEDADADAVPLADARRPFGRFLGHLPDEW